MRRPVEMLGAVLIALSLGLAPARPYDADTSRGDHVAAAERWEAALASARRSGDRPAEIEALERRAEALMALGFLDRAETDLTAALGLVDPVADPVAALRIKGLRGAVLTRVGRIDDARADLGESLLLASRTGERRLEAVTLNNIGNFLLLERRHDEALKIYLESAEIARGIGESALAGAALLNAADLLAGGGDHHGAARMADRAAAALGEPRNAQAISSLIKLGGLHVEIAAAEPALAREQARAAHAALTRAREAAVAIGNARLESYAAARLGEIYERAGRWAEAERLTREAIATAQRVNAPEAAYRWQWQLGRIRHARGDTEGAITSYQHAIGSLGAVRGDIVAGFGSGRNIFQETVRPLILDLADLLLRQAARVRSETERQRLLMEARGTVELLKAAEFEDYYHDDCLAALNAQRREIDVLPPGAAAVYPVVLRDRVELLLSIGGRLERVGAPVSAAILEQTVTDFRRGLSDPADRRYLPPAQRLHGWLIRPFGDRLDAAGIDTLVVVPSGLLASIPFAALHDGAGHLVERYAVAIVPGLTLVDPRPFHEADASALLGGLTASVQGFPALPHVAAEIAGVTEHYPTEVLRDRRLVRANLERALASAPFRIVHLATHAKFEADVSRSYLLTWDGRIDMQGLERLVRQSRFRDRPVELLTLSACSTAAGDPRAALGLAGVALKSGARSALASLWVVGDESTAALVTRFYSALARPGTSKAEALRDAQLSLIADPRFGHPAFWAPFLIIGNWL